MNMPNMVKVWRIVRNDKKEIINVVEHELWRIDAQEAVSNHPNEWTFDPPKRKAPEEKKEK